MLVMSEPLDLMGTFDPREHLEPPEPLGSTGVAGSVADKVVDGEAVVDVTTTVVGLIPE